MNGYQPVTSASLSFAKWLANDNAEQVLDHGGRGTVTSGKTPTPQRQHLGDG